MSGYAFGENCCDAKYASYILKYSPNGGLEWVKEICTKSAMDEFHEIAIDKNGILLVNIEVSIMDSTINNSIYYDGNLISPDNRNHRKWGYQMLLQINPETGNLLNSVWINEFVYPKIKLTDRNEIIWFGLIGDGKEPVWFKKFNGYSSDNLKTDLRSKGSADFYILCMDQDLQKKWDFTLGGEGNEYDYGSLDYSINGDTLFVFTCFYSDSIDIDPDPVSTYYIYGDKVFLNRDSMGAVLLAYDISGAQPELINYRKLKYTEMIKYNSIYSHPKVGTYMSVENKDWSMKNISDDYFLYASVDGDLNVVIDSTRPATRQTTQAYFYDSEGSFYVPNWRCVYGNDSLVIDYSSVMGRQAYSETDMSLAVLSKFKGGKHYWSALAKKCTWDEFLTVDKEGAVYIQGISNVIDKSHVGEKNGRDIIVDPNTFFIAKYRETYKVSSSGYMEHGQVVLPDTMVWHGTDCEVVIVPDAGYQVERVSVNGRELLPEADGRYMLRKVSGPDTVQVEMMKGSGVPLVCATKFDLVPNVVESHLLLPEGLRAESYRIFSEQGQTVQSGDASPEVNVSTLQPGIYHLVVMDGEEEKVARFVKKK